VAHVIHGTTLVANALIERQGVKTALVTTRGFRDVVEIGLEWRYDTYDLFARTAPRRWCRASVASRSPSASGPTAESLQALDEDSVAEVARVLLAQDVQAVGVCLLHSFLNDGARAGSVRDLLRQALPSVVVCISSDVVPEIGEYERDVDHAGQRLRAADLRAYLAAITRDLHAAGIRRDLYLMHLRWWHRVTRDRHPPPRSAWCSPARPVACRRPP
jgi:N-methylhydantoinase A